MLIPFRKPLSLALIALAGLIMSCPIAHAQEEDERWESERYDDHDQPPQMTVEAVEGPADTVSFHIGSPLFLRLRIPEGNAACAPFNGKPFFFDATGTQLGWHFEEVVDSLLFPNVSGDCERILMLSSENSNRLPEGVFTLKVAILFDAASRMTSNTIVVHPVHSQQGADSISYTRFLQEQIVGNNPLLHDPETLKALFADGVPLSAESEVFRALILYRTGDESGAEAALQSAGKLVAQRHAQLTPNASATSTALLARLKEEPPGQ